MGYESPGGEYVRGYLASNDLSAGADVPLFDRNGNARALAANERLVVDFITLNNGATISTITLYFDKNGNNALDAGEEVYGASVGVNAQNFMDDAEIHCPRVSAAGVGKLRAIASVASVGSRVIVVGWIALT